MFLVFLMSVCLCFSWELCLCGVLFGVRVFVCSGVVCNVFFVSLMRVLKFFMSVVFVRCVVWCACFCV